MLACTKYRRGPCNNRGVRRSTIALVAILAAVVHGSGCTDSPTAPSNNAPFTQTDLRVGTGAEAASGKVVSVHYTGWFYNESQTERKGAQFDSSIGQTPFSFTLGVGQVISGWDRGVAGMKVGGVRRLIIPPSLAYGSIRSGPIPPNATLLFDIELLEVQQ
jgi:FKBP-type peptidyl-prolyl cis-trans isomerase FkpA